MVMLDRGVFRSLQELEEAIHRFLDHCKANSRPFTWTKDANKMIAAIKTTAPSVRLDPLASSAWVLKGSNGSYGRTTLINCCTSTSKGTMVSARGASGSAINISIRRTRFLPNGNSLIS
jgi:hypothetical protein